MAVFFFLYKAPVVFFLLKESFEENKPVKLKYKINCWNSEMEWEEELYRNIIPVTKQVYLSPGIHQLEIQKENEIIFKQKIFILYNNGYLLFIIPRRQVHFSLKIILLNIFMNDDAYDSM